MLGASLSTSEDNYQWKRTLCINPTMEFGDKTVINVATSHSVIYLFFIFFRLNSFSRMPLKLIIAPGYPSENRLPRKLLFKNVMQQHKCVSKLLLNFASCFIVFNLLFITLGIHISMNKNMCF